jgi:hypothetical protein
MADVVPMSGRRNRRLRDLQHQLCLALGGEARARRAIRIAVPTSPDTLFRLTSSEGVLQLFGTGPPAVVAAL